MDNRIKEIDSKSVHHSIEMEASFISVVIVSVMTVDCRDRQQKRLNADDIFYQWSFNQTVDLIYSLQFKSNAQGSF